MSISREDKLFFSKHLATMVHAGVPLSDALTTLTGQANPELGKLLKKVVADVENGQSLGKSMGKYPKVFDALTINLIKAGETSGTLDVNLKYLAEQQNKDMVLRRKISGALLYPSLVIGATLIMGTLLSWFILPQLVDMFTSLDVQLPLSTKVLLWFANIMKYYGTFVVIGVFGFVILMSILLKLKPVKRVVDEIIIKLPIVGKVAIAGQLGLFCRNMGTLLASGLPVVDALQITTDSLDNLKFKDDLVVVKSRVSEGKTMYSSMGSKKYPEFSGLAVRMIEVGEKSGKLEEMLMYLADFYEEEIESISKNLSNLLEPVLLLIIGAVVGFVAMAIISPIYSLMGGIR